MKTYEQLTEQEKQIYKAADAAYDAVCNAADAAAYDVAAVIAGENFQRIKEILLNE